MKIPKCHSPGPHWKQWWCGNRLELVLIRYHNTVRFVLRSRPRCGVESNPQIGMEQGLPINVSTALHSHCLWDVLRQPLRLHWHLVAF